MDVLRSDITRDFAVMEKSGVLPWNESSWRDFPLPEMLSAFSNPTLFSGFTTDFMSELDSNANCLSFAFRRLKQTKTRMRKALPPIAKTMAVVMLIIDFILCDDSEGEGVGELEIVDGHGDMFAPVPQSPVLLYLKPCSRSNHPVMTFGNMSLSCNQRTASLP